MRVVEIIADLRVADIAAAREFSSGYLELSTEEFDMGWVARYTPPATGAHLRLVTRDTAAPEDPVISVEGDDVDRSARRSATPEPPDRPPAPG